MKRRLEKQGQEKKTLWRVCLPARSSSPKVTLVMQLERACPTWG
jgi:hypothetical protein